MTWEIVEGLFGAGPGARDITEVAFAAGLRCLQPTDFLLTEVSGRERVSKACCRISHLNYHDTGRPQATKRALCRARQCQDRGHPGGRQAQGSPPRLLAQAAGFHPCHAARGVEGGGGALQGGGRRGGREGAASGGRQRQAHHCRRRHSVSHCDQGRCQGATATPASSHGHLCRPGCPAAPAQQCQQQQHLRRCNQGLTAERRSGPAHHADDGIGHAAAASAAGQLLFIGPNYYLPWPCPNSQHAGDSAQERHGRPAAAAGIQGRWHWVHWPCWGVARGRPRGSVIGQHLQSEVK